MIYETIHLKEHYPELGVDGCDAYVDCYIPSPVMDGNKEYGPKKHPAIIVCPGGGYGGTSRREAEVVGMHFLSEGYRVFVIYYSVKPHQFPQQIREIAGLMEIIYKNAQEWAIDTNKIGIMGFSAGGHLAAQYTNRYDCPEIRELFPESKPVQACGLCYAVLTAEKEYTHAHTMLNYIGHEPVDGADTGCACELLVSDNTPPTFLWHTAADQGVAVENSLIYARALSAHKVPFELHVYPYGQHGLATADELVYNEVTEQMAHAHQWIADMKRWLKLMGF